MFLQIMQKVMDSFQPNAVVLQCGADSLTGDRLGCFNLTLKGTDSFEAKFRLLNFLQISANSRTR